MSPATSAVISGNIQTAPNSRITSGTARPLRVRYEREREVAPVAVVTEVDRDDEDDRHDCRGAEPEVRALLVAQLGQLPAVDGQRPSALIGTPPREGARTGPAIARHPRSVPSVSEKNRSSSVTVCGASAWISAPASTSAWDSSATAASSAVKQIRPCSTRTSAIPGCARQTASARSSSVRRKPVGRAGAAFQSGDLALVDDLAPADDRHPVAQLLDLGEQVAREQDRDPLIRQAPDQHPHVAHARGVQAGRRLVEQQQLRVRSSAAAIPSRWRIPWE